MVPEIAAGVAPDAVHVTMIVAVKSVGELDDGT